MIDKNKVVIRSSIETDDIKQIAKLIYSSDMDIYGAMFGDVICASQILQELIPTAKINIRIKNLIVAEYEKSVVGILCFIEDDYINDRGIYKKAFAKLGLQLPKYFDRVFDTYWKKVIEEDFTNSFYISNIAVDESYQNLGIGKMLLNYFKEKYKGKTIGLDVVKDNLQAINTYIKSGFEIVEKENINRDLPAPVRMMFSRK